MNVVKMTVVVALFQVAGAAAAWGQCYVEVAKLCSVEYADEYDLGDTCLDAGGTNTCLQNPPGQSGPGCVWANFVYLANDDDSFTLIDMAEEETLGEDDFLCGSKYCVKRQNCDCQPLWYGKPCRGLPPGLPAFGLVPDCFLFGAQCVGQ
jgi:hypothetical protein